jgi:hypothetical protein
MTTTLGPALLASFSDELEKISFQASMYSGPMGPGGFKMESDAPPFTAPTLKKKVAAGLPTPKQQFASSRRNFAEPVVSSPPGPSIAQQAKPVGFGHKMPGAGKGNNAI